MPFVASISRLSIANQAPFHRSAAGLSGLVGLMAFAVLVVLTSVNWSTSDETGVERTVEETAPAPYVFGTESSRLLTAHTNLTSLGVLHSQPVQD
jgi:hypothetical protein